MMASAARDSRLLALVSVPLLGAELEDDGRKDVTRRYIGNR